MKRDVTRQLDELDITLARRPHLHAVQSDICEVSGVSSIRLNFRLVDESSGAILFTTWTHTVLPLR